MDVAILVDRRRREPQPESRCPHDWLRDQPAQDVREPKRDRGWKVEQCEELFAECRVLRIERACRPNVQDNRWVLLNVQAPPCVRR